MNWSVVSAPWWPEVWIVGGGPSARQFNLEQIAGRQVLAVNDAIKVCANLPSSSVALFSGDIFWLQRNHFFVRAFPGEKFAGVHCLVDIPDLQCLRRGYSDGLSDDHGRLEMGGNSGYAAINLAVLKGARTIHLVGFDMNGPEAKFQQWIPRFHSMLPALDRKGIQVLNHNPASAIDAFWKVPLCEKDF